MIKGAIFDLDGTLLDSMGAWNNVGERYLTEHGITPPPDLTDRLKTFSMKQTAGYVRGHYGIPGTDEEIIAEINRFVEREYLDRVPLKAGAAEFLQRLGDAGVRCCVATATDRYLAEAALKRLGVLGCFDFLLTCTEAGAGKDSPRIYERALELLGTQKSDTLVFEDAYHAVQTAAGAGFRVVALREATALDEADSIRKTAEIYADSFAECEVTAL